MISIKIHVTGIVQGVGFRPFIYNLANLSGLTGWVCNTSAGVDIVISGVQEEIDTFIQTIRTNPPTLSRIDSVVYNQIPFTPYPSFEIIQSKEISNAFQPISPDICICKDCLDELFDRENRRFRYPFINCTNCGPRLTIIEEIPYDRPLTTMKDFEMCPDCKSEYTDPTDRRFHAQPIACPVCGPQVWLELPTIIDNNRNRKIPKEDDAIREAQKLLLNGKIIAIKGIGGFHLACDATNQKAVSELRKRKFRVDKPFAVMFPDLTTAGIFCIINDYDQELLESRERPIVILNRSGNTTIARDISPNQNTIGVMLPYTPLHYLLFDTRISSDVSERGKQPKQIPPLVMTSGNLSEEPIAVHNDDARNRLSGIADAFLMHNRTIRTRCDDSVIRTFHGYSFPIRRSRGYSPFPVYLAKDSPQIIAVGAELKNTFCIVRDRYAFLSHHIGDMENVETYDSFTDSIAHYEALFKVKPEALAFDLHPNYLATRYAIERAEKQFLPSFGVQHHHAHIVSCMVENSIPSNQPVIGVAFDGTGYGEDGAIWGGEFLIVDYKEYKRVCHLKYIPLPGGDNAIRKPARIALAYLWANNTEWDPDYPPVSALCPEERSILKSQLKMKINTPQTSSMGRFFDAIASLVGVRHKVNYEAQAAIEFEALADPHDTGEYNWLIDRDGNTTDYPFQINPGPLVDEVLADMHQGIATSIISARFHNTIANMVSNVCNTMRSEFELNTVVLSGGVWQNITLLNHTYNLLTSANFNVIIHHQVPTNDGGLALGQALIAIHRMKV